MKDSFVTNFISDKYSFQDDFNRHSCLAAAIRDARKFANRDIDSGEVTFENDAPLFPNAWPTALLYLIILEQIGTCFINKQKEKVYGNSIYKALKYFSDLPTDKAHALESLRHSFAHSYGLCNVKQGKKGLIQSHTHIFLLTASKSGELIILPKNGKEWSGDYNSKMEESHTQINLWAFGDFVEKLFKNLKHEYEDDNVELILEGGIIELKTKYTFLS